MIGSRLSDCTSGRRMFSGSRDAPFLAVHAIGFVRARMCRLNEDARERTTPSDASTSDAAERRQRAPARTRRSPAPAPLAHSTLGSQHSRLASFLFPLALHFHSTLLPARLTTTDVAVDPRIAHRHEPLLVRLHLLIGPTGHPASFAPILRSTYWASCVLQMLTQLPEGSYVGSQRNAWNGFRRPTPTRARRR